MSSSVASSVAMVVLMGFLLFGMVGSSASLASCARSAAVRSAARPGRPRSRLWWLAITIVARSRARASRGRRRRAGRSSSSTTRAGRRATGAGCRAAPALDRARARPPPHRRAAGAPARSVATASGSSRSGSGVTDSHDARLTMGGRLTATDHKVRIKDHGSWSPPPPARRQRAAPPSYTDPTLQEAEQELIFERTWQLAGHVSALPGPAATSPRARAPSRSWSCATRTRACARTATSAATGRSRLLSGVGPMQGRDPLPLPRLDLPVRRHADRRAGGARVRREARQVARSA